MLHCSGKSFYLIFSVFLLVGTVAEDFHDLDLNHQLIVQQYLSNIFQILQELKGKIMKLMPEEHASCVEDFVSQYQRVAGQLRALIYRASCPQLIKHNQVRILYCLIYKRGLFLSETLFHSNFVHEMIFVIVASF